MADEADVSLISLVTFIGFLCSLRNLITTEVALGRMGT